MEIGFVCRTMSFRSVEVSTTRPVSTGTKVNRNHQSERSQVLRSSSAEKRQAIHIKL